LGQAILMNWQNILFWLRPIMKKYLLLAFVLLSSAHLTVAERFIIENYLGISCLRHKIKSEETFYEIARQYFVRPSTLALVNNVKNVESLEQRVLYIPLTETNFYQTKGILGGVFDFNPVYYTIQKESDFEEVAKQFFVSTIELKKWNPTASTISKGEKLVVGWLKQQRDPATAKAPTFILKEKILYGTSDERLEAKMNADKKDLLSTTPSFVDYSLPKNAVPVQSKEINKNENLQIVSTNIPQGDKVENKKRLNATDAKNVQVASRERKTTPKLTKSNRIKRKSPVSLEISKAEREFLKENTEKKQVKKKSQSQIGIWSKVKKLTQNSYARKKAKVKYEGQESMTAKVVTKKPKPSKPVLVKLKEVKEKSAVSTKPIIIDKTYKVEVEKAEVKEAPNEPVYVENKLLRLTLLKSMKGRIAFFYSGTAGAKFYVFTNLAAKGGVIKLTNLTNNKYILAQVIGPLPEVDRKRGYIVKLSDNSRRIIGVKSKSFTAKVNY